MLDQSPSERLPSEMPPMTAVSAEASREIAAALRPARLATFVLVSMVCLLAAGWLLVPAPPLKSPAGSPPRIDVPAAATGAAVPHATEAEPWIATVAEIAKPWSVKDFFYK